MLESFRGQPCEATIAAMLSELALEEPDLATLELVLGDTIDGLRRRMVKNEINSRKHELSKEEWLELLTRKTAKLPPE